MGSKPTDPDPRLRIPAVGKMVGPRPNRWLSIRLHSLVRWLHIYSSLLGFMSVLFFGFTGLTLNHPDWFGGMHETLREEKGELSASLLPGGEADFDSLAIVEYLRAEHRITAAVRDVQADEFQVSIAFAGPGYTADVWIDRPSRTYQLSETRLGVIAVINDLHKGRVPALSGLS